MKTWGCWLLAGGFAVAGLCAQAGADEGNMSWLDNGTIRLGVDLSLGGAVTYLHGPGPGENMINSYDWGRQIQMSFYSGPSPFAPEGHELHPRWNGLGWNPIQSGDCYNNRSRTIEHRNDENGIYVKSIPMIWPLNAYPGECTFETWYALKGNTVEVRCRIQNNRPDKVQYPGRNQELPAVYTNGRWYKMTAYMGDKPFTGAPVTTIVGPDDDKGWPWRNFYTTENWVALLDQDDTGLGIWAPDIFTFAGGYAGAPKGQGGDKDFQTGYMSPVQPEILDHDIVYEYRYVLIAGSLQEIREYVYAHTPERKVPAWSFENDRQHWHYGGTTDAGWPIEGELHVNLGANADAVLRSPRTYWVAEDAPFFHLEAAFSDAGEEVKLILESYGPRSAGDWPQWGPERSAMPPEDLIGPIAIPIISDGTFRRYRVDLNSLADYHGTITGLRLVLPQGKGSVRIRSIGLATE